MDIMVLKVKSIIITLLFLLVAYTPAHATVYFSFDAEDGTVGNNVPNPPFCQTECTGTGSKATYQSSGGAPQGSKYFQWQTVDNQPNAYTEIHPSLGFPITNVMGKTYYLAYFFNFSRIDGKDIWHDTDGVSSADKGVEIWGDGIRWVLSRGNWPTAYYSIPSNQDHRYTIWIGNPTYHLNASLERNDAYMPNLNSYSYANPIQLEYEKWYSFVMAIEIASDNTGYVIGYIDGIKLFEYTNIKTTANSGTISISGLKMGGTIAQQGYDAPAHYRKFDAMIFTDNWQDIVDGGYLGSAGGNTPPPSSSSGGDASASGGSGCGFVKDDGKGQGLLSPQPSELSMVLILLLLLIFIRLKRRSRLC